MLSRSLSRRKSEAGECDRAGHPSCGGRSRWRLSGCRLGQCRQHLGFRAWRRNWVRNSMTALSPRPRTSHPPPTDRFRCKAVVLSTVRSDTQRTLLPQLQPSGSRPGAPNAFGSALGIGGYPVAPGLLMPLLAGRSLPSCRPDIRRRSRRMNPIHGLITVQGQTRTDRQIVTAQLGSGRRLQARGAGIQQSPM